MGLVLLSEPVSEQKEYGPSVERSSAYGISLVMMRVGRWKVDKWFYYTYPVFQNANTCLHAFHSPDTYTQGRYLSVSEAFGHKMRT